MSTLSFRCAKVNAEVKIIELVCPVIVNKCAICSRLKWKKKIHLIAADKSSWCAKCLLIQECRLSNFLIKWNIPFPRFPLFPLFPVLLNGTFEEKDFFAFYANNFELEQVRCFLSILILHFIGKIIERQSFEYKRMLLLTIVGRPLKREKNFHLNCREWRCSVSREHFSRFPLSLSYG